jgi:membrane fusion protein (multidrug efflux system)
MKFSIFALFLSALLFTSCQEKQEVKLRVQKLQVFEVKSQTVPVYKEFVGQIYGKSDIPIRARVEGFLDKIHFKEGSRVEKGQLLYSVDPEPYMQNVASKKSKLAQSKTNLVQKESDLERIIPLAEMDAISKRELDMTRAKRDAAKSEVKSDEAILKLAEINLGYAAIYSPLTGLIGRTMAREGEFVGKEPNPIILNTVSNVESVRVQFFLSENEYLAISREYKAAKKAKKKSGRILEGKVKEEFKDNVELIFSDGTIYGLLGNIDFIDRSVDPNTGAILLQASFANPDLLIRPGQFGRVKINIRNAEKALLVPQKCLKELQGKYSLFVVNPENKVEARQVEVGETVDDYWLIESGLKVGEKVLLEGIQKVRPGMKIIPEVVAFKSRKEKI